MLGFLWKVHKQYSRWSWPSRAMGLCVFSLVIFFCTLITVMAIGFRMAPVCQARIIWVVVATLRVNHHQTATTYPLHNKKRTCIYNLYSQLNKMYTKSREYFTFHVYNGDITRPQHIFIKCFRSVFREALRMPVCACFAWLSLVMMMKCQAFLAFLCRWNKNATADSVFGLQ